MPHVPGEVGGCSLQRGLQRIQRAAVRVADVLRAITTHRVALAHEEGESARGGSAAAAAAAAADRRGLERSLQRQRAGAGPGGAGSQHARHSGKRGDGGAVGEGVAVRAEAQRSAAPGGNNVAGIGVPGPARQHAHVHQGGQGGSTQRPRPLRSALQVASEVASKGRDVWLIAGLHALQGQALLQQRCRCGGQDGAVSVPPRPRALQDGREGAVEGAKRSADGVRHARAAGGIEAGGGNGGARRARASGSGPKGPKPVRGPLAALWAAQRSHEAQVGRAGRARCPKGWDPGQHAIHLLWPRKAKKGGREGGREGTPRADVKGRPAPSPPYAQEQKDEAVH